MPRRYQVLATNEVYHVFNRSIGKEQIFTYKRDLERIMELIDYYRYPQILRYSQFKLLSANARKEYLSNMQRKVPLVEIYCFTLMPNHYHLLLKQIQEKGITYFIANLQNSFAKYFNLKRNRNGGVFQSPFKAKRIETDEEMWHISRYIHLNPVTSFLIPYEKLSSYPWTSFPLYINAVNNSFVNTEEVLGQFQKKESYLSFVADQVDYQRKLEMIKHLILE